MKLRSLVATSLQPLRTNPLRTLLSVSGVAIGVAAVLVSSAIGEGARTELTRSLETLGTNLIIVKPLPVRRTAARRQAVGMVTTFTLEDADEISALPNLLAVAPALEGKVRVKAGSISTHTTVRGSSAAYISLRHFRLAGGRAQNTDEEKRSARVAVLGAMVARQLFPAVNPLGRELRIRGVPFEIIGVLEEKGAAVDSADQDNQVLIPLSTALRRVFNVRWLTSAYVGVEAPEFMTGAESAISTVLRKRHGLVDLRKPDDFSVQNTAKTRAMQQELTASLSRYGSGLGAIALLVGGTGVLALMSLSVRERRAEIGLRMALGALPRDILLQFLTEALLMAHMGWAAGCGVAVLAIIAIKTTANWTLCTPLGTGLWALAASILVGLLFGALPARRAARIPPIEALVKR